MHFNQREATEIDLHAVGLIGGQWQECWDLSCKLDNNSSPEDLLCDALAVFIDQQVEIDGGETEAVTLIATIMFAISKEGTHTKAALKEALNRLHGNTKSDSKISNLLSPVNTKQKRMSLLMSPFFAVITLFILHQDIVEMYEWEPSLSFTLFLMVTTLCLLVSFTRLGDWISGN